MNGIKLIVKMLILTVVLLVTIILVISGYMSGEIIDFGRANHEVHEVSKDKTAYWYSLMSFIVLAFFIGGVWIYEFIKTVKEFRRLINHSEAKEDPAPKETRN